MFLKVLCIVVLLLFVQEATASCIQYGHACWGGHGKRNDGKSATLKPQEWFLSRLINPAEVATFFEEDDKDTPLQINR